MNYISLVVLVLQGAFSLAATGSHGREALLGGSFATGAAAANYEVLLGVSWAGGGGGACSGTVIAPGVVLTAGHCVYGENGGGYMSAAYVFGEARLLSPACVALIAGPKPNWTNLGPECGNPPLAATKAAALGRGPGQTPPQFAYQQDLGLLLVPGLTAAPYAPLVANDVGAAYGSRGSALIMGYGYRAALKNASVVDATVQPLQWGGLRTLPESACQAVTSIWLPPAAPDKLCGLHAAAAPCFGDSGGGVFLSAPSGGFAAAAGRRLLGVAAVTSSFKDTTLKGTSCLAAPLNFFAKVAPYAAWLNATLAAWGAPKPVWVSAPPLLPTPTQTPASSTKTTAAPAPTASASNACAFAASQKSQRDPWVLGVAASGAPFWCGAVAVTRDAALTTAACVAAAEPPYAPVPLLMLVTDGSDPLIAVERAAASRVRIVNPASAAAAAGVATPLLVTSALPATSVAAAAAAAAAAGAGLPAPEGTDLALLVAPAAALTPQPLDRNGALNGTRQKLGLRLGGQNVSAWPATDCAAYAAPLRRSGVACAPLTPDWSPCSGDAGRPVRAAGTVVALQSTNVPQWAHIWAAGGSLRGACENNTAAVALLAPISPALPWLRAALASASAHASDLLLAQPVCTPS